MSRLLGIVSIAAFLSTMVPAAKADTVTVPVEEIVAIAPVATDTGRPFPAEVSYFVSGINFSGTTSSGSFNIGYAWQALANTSMQYFGDANAEIVAWDGSMSFAGCDWTSSCLGTLTFGDTGVTGTGFMSYSPHYAYVAINSLTYSTPEPGSLAMLVIGVLGLLVVSEGIGLCSPRCKTGRAAGS